MSLIKKFYLYGPLKFFFYALSELKYRLVSNVIFNSYSQHGEDLKIDSLLGYKDVGFYVDIGAYDPSRFSNTKRFYKTGWRGINVEPGKDRFKEFIKLRPRDINLNIGVAMFEGELNFYQMFPDTLSTFSKEDVLGYQNKGFKIQQEYPVKVLPLSKILDKYAETLEIDLLSIDTEGYEMNVLKSNNWSKYKPRIICIESSNPSGEKDNINEVHDYLLSLGYKVCHENGTNTLYARE